VIYVQVESGLELPYQAGAEQSLSWSLLTAWNSAWVALLVAPPILLPLFDEVSPDEIRQMAADIEEQSGIAAPDLMRWYIVDPGAIDPDLAAQTLRALPFVAQADVRRDLAEIVNPYANPQFANQRYLLAASEGIDALYAWSTLGGDGNGIRIVDVEYGWWDQHEDLSALQVDNLGGIIDQTADHGTAVFGILAAADNGVGCIGIAPAAKLAFSSVKRALGAGVFNPDKNVANAIFRAIQYQWKNPSVPMVLLIEVGHPIEGGKPNALPPEVDLPVPSLIEYAIQNGMTVVEGAGNGNVNLDTFTRNGTKPLVRANYDSGAIMVASTGAGMSLSKTAHSSYGSRVDCFAWGDGVRTCTSELSPISSYKDFTGTSAAAAIVAGAATVVQGVAIARTGSAFSPAKVRQLLSDTTLNTHAVSAEPIGVMPNLRAIVDSIPIGP
jgi:subtilisin family serine protease